MQIGLRPRPSARKSPNPPARARAALLALLGFLLAVLCLLLAGLPARADAPDDIKLLPITPDIATAAAQALQGCPPAGQRTVAGLNRNGVYTMTGDLFGNGHLYAVIDHHDKVIVCQWVQDQWKVVSAIGVATEWNHPGWDSQTEGRKPRSTAPFWMLSLDHRSLLVIASGMEKYGQNYEVILFDPTAARILDACDSYQSYFESSPYVDGHYLVTADGSRNKAEWGGIYFSQIRKNQFVVAKSWAEWVQDIPAEFSQFGDVADCDIVTSEGKSYIIMDGFEGDDQLSEFVIYRGALHDSPEWREIVDLGKTHPVYAKVHFHPRERKSGAPYADVDANETAYLFEKLTGLPRRLYRIGEGYDAKEKIESLATIQVTGSAAAVQQLSPQ